MIQLPTAQVQTTCPYCGVGCGVTASSTNGELESIKGNQTHPANRGKLCVKGSHLADTLHTEGRLSTPLLEGVPASWPRATHYVAQQLGNTIRDHGPDSIAFYLSGQLLTEDYYVANKLMKGFIGSANVDTNSRLCMASSVAAHKRAFGEDVVPCNYSDIDQANLIILVGSNAAWAHPILFQRIASVRDKAGAKVIVVDPRKTATCEIADIHLQIKPGSDAVLFAGLLSHLIREEAIDHHFIQQHTERFDEVLASPPITLDNVAHLTQLRRRDIENFYKSFAVFNNVITLFSQGINQSSSGTDKANAIINCHLATGRIGRVGQGPFSITGQPNAMGGREVGGMANQLAAHMDFEPSDIDRVGRFWKSPNIATKPGRKAVEMFDAVKRGEIKAIWIMGTNPAVSLPHLANVRTALKTCPLVIVSDCMRVTDTNKYANVLLPAQAWGEKEGTVTNSERCISRQRSIRSPYALSRPDWAIVCDVARAMGYSDAFQYESVHEVFLEHARLSAFENQGQRLFNLTHLSELSAQDYDELQPTYWPTNNRPFSHHNFTTPSGRARFVPVTFTPPSQQVSSQYPFVLNTGRIRDQWHTMTRTGQVAKLFSHTYTPSLEIHPEDAKQLTIHNGDVVEIFNGYGEARLIARVNDTTPQGVLFAPMHWTDQFANNAIVGQLVGPCLDPISGQPESKHSAVACRRIDSHYRVHIVSQEKLHTEALHNLDCLEFWTGSPNLVGWQYLMAAQTLDALTDLLPKTTVASYTDSRGIVRMLGRTDGHVSWIMFAGKQSNSLPPLSHLMTQLVSQLPDWQKLSASTQQNRDSSDMVCSCFEVRKAAIEAGIKSGASSPQVLGRLLKCGTNCGSCIPEISSLIKITQAEPMNAEAISEA